MRLGDTPVPIPNTTVKTQEADGTALETVWESRWMPDLRGCSSVGRAPALQAGGQEFESLHLHLIIQRAAAGLAGKLFRACSNKAGQTSQTGYSKNILNEENLFSECSGCGVVRNTENLVRFTV